MSNILTTTFSGLNLSNPIIIGSCGLTNKAEKNKELEKAGAGAIVLPSLFEEQIEIQTRTGIFADCPKAIDFIDNAIDGISTTDYLNLIKESKKQCKIPIIASINCYRENGWIDFISQIEMAGADAIELNIFALNAEKKQQTDSIENIYLRIAQRVKKLVNIPVIIKMGKYFSNIVKLTADLQEAGADGVVLFSRFYQPDIDIHQLQVNSGYVFTSPSDIADTLRWSLAVNREMPDASLASCTGIHDWEDVVKCLLCGVSAVEICSSVYQHGNEIIHTMKQGLEEWMNIMNFDSLGELKGKLHYGKIKNPSLYERIQFIKYFSNRD